MLDNTSHLLIIRQKAAEPGLRKLIIDIILTIVRYWAINFRQKMFNQRIGEISGRRGIIGGRGIVLYCFRYFQCKALALAVILRCVSPMSDFSLRSYERFKKR